MRRISSAVLLLGPLLAATAVSCGDGAGERNGTADHRGAPAESGGGAPAESGGGAPAAALTDSGSATERGALARYRLAGRPASLLPLHSGLREVSGIAFGPGGELYAHNDERGTVYRVDRATGKMRSQFAVGERRLSEDMEDIAVVGDTIYLVNSAGDLFAFKAGGDRANVPYAKYVTRLGSKNDVEGLCYDPETASLLLACKSKPGVDSQGVRAVYAFDLASRSLGSRPRFLIDLGELKRRFGVKDFRPSGIARHPAGGTFLIISAVGNTIVELAADGHLIGCADLPKKFHEQPEGIAFDESGALYIASEGSRRGRIAVFPAEDP